MKPISLLLTATLLSGAVTPVFAADTGAILGGALGGAAGAVIGQNMGGSNGAVLGAAIGGAAGVAIAGDDHRNERVYVRDNYYVRERHRPAPRYVYVDDRHRHDRYCHHDNGNHNGWHKGKH